MSLHPRSAIRSPLTGLLTALPLVAASLVSNALAVEPDASWPDVLEEARGQTVWFNAWGGSDRINEYLEWASDEVQREYGVTLEHVKVGDIAEIVSQLAAARAAGQDSDGRVDLMWINGENFVAMKEGDMIWGAFADALPNAALVRESPSITFDFSVAVEGLESPWGGAQLVFIHDTATLPEPPRSAAELLAFVQDGDGRFAYPAPPAFHGTTFLKQLLGELVEERHADALALPAEASDIEAVTAPLWSYLDELHPQLRGEGRTWPANGEATRQLLDDGELDIALSFNPNEASAAVRDGQLPDSVRTYVFDGGTIGNTHFVTIPWNTGVAAGAQVVANFLLSPAAQARKADPAFWGDPTVLSMDALDDGERALFEAVDLGPWSLPIGTGSVLPEPHASWAATLENLWLTRYGS